MQGLTSSLVFAQTRRDLVIITVVSMAQHAALNLTCLAVSVTFSAPMTSFNRYSDSDTRRLNRDLAVFIKISNVTFY